MKKKLDEELNKKLEKFLKNFGKNIKMKRNELKITQEKLAEIIDIQPRNLQEIEYGKVNTTVTSIFKISKALQCTPAELLCTTDEIVVKTTDNKDFRDKFSSETSISLEELIFVLTNEKN